MTRAEIVREIQQLPIQEQLEIHKALTNMVKKREQSSVSNHLRAAANALLADYQNDPELTAFTALDCEDFHEAR